jgi:hypothetical protein
VRFPSPFADMLGFMNLFALDFPSLECLQHGSNSERYFSRLYLWSVVPLAVEIMIGLHCLVMLKWFSLSKREAIISRHVWMALFVTYLVLPAVANKHFQSLDCITFKDEGISFLRADSGISCYSQGYESFRVILILFIIIYQSIPILWYVILRKHKHMLNRESPDHDEALELHIRDNAEGLDYIRFLFQDYKVKIWWFEVFEMYRRMMFISMLPLTSSSTSKRASFGVILSIASVA